nr:DUF4198 domain-containing protein [uncultured Methanospirillum sp.]
MKEYNLELMIQGHEIWLERSDVEKGTVSLSLLYGHNMKQDGLVDESRFQPHVYYQDGHEGEIELRTVDDRHYLIFKEGETGYMSAYADMGVVIYSKNEDGYNQGPKFQFKGVVYSGAFHQMAKIIVPGKKPENYRPQPTHGILEIVPAKPECTVGSEIELTVYYEDKPLPSVLVKAISKKEGKDLVSIETDNKGVVKIPISRDGEWMFLARHVDSTKKVSDEFDESVFITTLVLDAT